jgi:hypothetical protein
VGTFAQASRMQLSLRRGESFYSFRPKDKRQKSEWRRVKRQFFREIAAKSRHMIAHSAGK